MNILFRKPLLQRKVLLLFMAALLSMPAMAQPPVPNTMSNPLAQVLVFIIAALAVAIAILANVVNGAASVFREKMKQEREAKNSSSDVFKAMLVLVVLSILSAGSPAMAQAVNNAVAPAVDDTINGLAPLTFYVLIGVIAVEIIIMLALIYQLKFLMGIEKIRVLQDEAAKGPSLTEKLQAFWYKMNQSKAPEQEAEIDLNHDYDGIRELDNKIPPWWRWVFILTIVFAMSYLWRYHVAKSAPLQGEEFRIAMAKAEVEKAEYLKIAGNKVDENTVVMLDESGIAAGKAIFSQNCIACHGPNGQGGAVGPNLSDDYWIHGGKINDVFKTIKYGWQEKGMRSWKDDFNPTQIAQLASFVKSLKGAKLPNPKEPQGDLYTEGAASDSSKVAVKDSAAKK